MRIRFLVLTAVFLSTGCGDDRSGPGGGIDAPDCMPGEVHVVGTLGDLPIDETISIDGHGFVNAIGDSNGYFEGYFLGSPALRLEFPDLLPNGENGPAAGMVDFASFGGVVAGNCLPATAFPGEIHIPESDAAPGAFVLRDLHESPACTGPEIAGELRGCWIVPQD